MCPHGWMLHHCGHTFLWERCVHNGVASTHGGHLRLLRKVTTMVYASTHCGHTFQTIVWKVYASTHCGHTFLYSLRWPHGWHPPMRSSQTTEKGASTHEVISDYRERCVHNGVASTHEVISDYRERCVHNCVASHPWGHLRLQRKVCPQWCSIHLMRWMLTLLRTHLSL